MFPLQLARKNHPNQERRIDQLRSAVSADDWAVQVLTERLQSVERTRRDEAASVAVCGWPGCWKSRTKKGQKGTKGANMIGWLVLELVVI